LNNVSTYNKEDKENFDKTISVSKTDRPVEEYEITNFKDYNSFNMNAFKSKFAKAGYGKISKI